MTNQKVPQLLKQSVLEHTINRLYKKRNALWNKKMRESLYDRHHTKLTDIIDELEFQHKQLLTGVESVPLNSPASLRDFALVLRRTKLARIKVSRGYILNSNMVIETRLLRAEVKELEKIILEVK